eukprot:TRINITY_DN18432_c0_g1_i1.p1 TRINITY_DN18432_c0_g1~~TRINITY_DN18432_c0_g1_i1.p1  ORF type:complete len:551 (+),score=94.55 TRINITY_DN18432_c0_g1_i1:165-1817(+)
MNLLLLSWLGLVLIAVQARESCLPSITLRQSPSGERIFVDPTGRQRIFHGVNVVVKGPPWYPSRDGFDKDTSLVREDFELMQAAGMNSLRLGLMWPGAEPERDQYNMTYFKIIKDIIDEAARYGIYTFVDMHQDAFGELFCGEGLPRWACSTDGTWLRFPEPVMSAFKPGPDGFPTRQDCDRLEDKLKMNGQGGYLTAAAEETAQNLYTNHNGVTDAWGKFFAKFAAISKDCGSVLGFNLINEPFTGMAYHNPLRLLPKFANKLLQGAYDIVARHIREIDEDRLIFFPGVPWSDLHDHEVDDGFTHAPGGDEYSNRSVLTFHYYIPPQVNNSERTYVDIMLKNAQRLKTGLFMSESFGVAYDGLPWEQVAPVVENVGVSWSYWEWKTFCKETPETLNGTSQWAAFGACKTGYGGYLFTDTGIDPRAHRELGRMYAHAVQGILISHVYNKIASTLNFEFDFDPSIGGPTEVFANRRWHGGPSGEFDVTVLPEGSLSVEVHPWAGEAVPARMAHGASGPADAVNIRLVPSAAAAAGRVSVAIAPRQVETLVV